MIFFRQSYKQALTFPVIVSAIIMSCLSVSLAAQASAAGHIPRLPPTAINPNWVQVSNNYLLLGVEPTTGQFHLFTANPSNPQGIISAGAIGVGKTTLRIDPPANNPQGNVANFGEGGQMPTLPIKTDAGTVYSVYTTQVGFTGGENSANSGFAIRVEQRLTLLRDALKVQYTIHNNGRVVHRIGLRVVIDQDMGGTLGGVYVVPGRPPLQFQTEFSPTNMPTSYKVFDDTRNPSIVGFGRLIGDEATPPDRLVIASATGTGSIASFPFDIPSNPFGQLPQPGTVPFSTATAYFYNDTDYQVGQVRTFTIYFGLGVIPPNDQTSDYEPNPVVALVAPQSIALQAVTTPAPGGTQGPFQFSPKNFSIQGFVYNTSQVAIADTTAQLILPAGLDFQQGETSSKSTGPIPAFGEKSVTWNLTVNGLASGELPLVMTTTSPGASSKSVIRTIDVPPFPQDFTAGSGLRMLSFPYTFDDADPRQVLIDQTTGGALNPIKLATFDPDLGDYLYFDTSRSKQRIEFTKLEAGKGYWLQSSRDTPLTLKGAHLIPTTQDFLAPLKHDWNMIGSPFVQSVFLGRTRFFFQSQSYTWLDAVLRGLIRPSLFTWDPTQGEYVAFGHEFNEIAPMVGYWINVQADGLTMVFPSDFKVLRSIGGSSLPEQSGASSPLPTNRFTLPHEYRGTALESYDPRLVRNLHAEWMLRICARSADARFKDTHNFIGVSPQASDRYNLQDVDKPPPFAGYVNLRFPHRDWGRDSGLYMQDVRAPFNGKKTWDMEVVTDQPDTDIVVTWPTISQVPRGYRFTLVDLESNKRTYMRAMKAYAFRSAKEGGVRHFRIEVDNAPGGALRITGVAVSTSMVRSPLRSITYNLSQAANVRCEIKALSGRTVRVLDSGAARSKGLNFISWDQRGEAGQILPRGIYFLEIIATTGEQQTVRVVKTLRIG